jgi:hypothetical protein
MLTDVNGSGGATNVLVENEPEPFASDPAETGAATREVEEGVSSSGASDQQQGRPGPATSAQPSRTPIVWDANPAQPASTSPQRPVARSIVSLFCIVPFGTLMIRRQRIRVRPY